MNKKKVLYACCYKGNIDLDGYEITYVDIIPNLRNDNYICKDIREVDFSAFDIIVASPPCNYWSIANYRREKSRYSQITKDLLPYCIKECLKIGKPFIIENVRNYALFEKNGIYNLGAFYTHYGRHTYFTSKLFQPSCKQIKEHITYTPRNKRQGGDNVNNVFKEFLESCYE